MKLDPRVSLGNILTAVTIVISLVGQGVYIGNKIGALEAKVDVLWQRFVGEVYEAPSYQYIPEARAEVPKRKRAVAPPRLLSDNGGDSPHARTQQRTPSEEP